MLSDASTSQLGFRVGKSNQWMDSGRADIKLQLELVEKARFSFCNVVQDFKIATPPDRRKCFQRFVSAQNQLRFKKIFMDFMDYFYLQGKIDKIVPDKVIKAGERGSVVTPTRCSTVLVNLK